MLLQRCISFSKETCLSTFTPLYKSNVQATFSVMPCFPPLSHFLSTDSWKKFPLKTVDFARVNFWKNPLNWDFLGGIVGTIFNETFLFKAAHILLPQAELFFFFLISPFICIFCISLWAILGLSSLHVGSKNQLSTIQKHRRKLQLHNFKTKLSITGTHITAVAAALRNICKSVQVFGDSYRTS